MNKNSSVRLTLLLTMLIIAGTLTSPRALVGGQNSAGKTGYREFSDRIEAYEKLHKVAEKSLPALRKTTKPELIAAHQEALVKKIRELRTNAQQGDIFTVSATEAIKRETKELFAGPDSRRVRTTINAGEPLTTFKVEINQKYPENLPFTTMPPTLLLKLPRLPEEVAYRLLGSTLLLVDRTANIIVDFMPNAIP